MLGTQDAEWDRDGERRGECHAADGEMVDDHLDPFGPMLGKVWRNLLDHLHLGSTRSQTGTGESSVAALCPLNLGTVPKLRGRGRALGVEHAVEGAPGEFGALDARRHVRDVLKLSGLVEVFEILLGEGRGRALGVEHAVEGAPGEFGALDARRHVRDVLKLSGLVEVFEILLGDLLAADHGEEKTREALCLLDGLVGDELGHDVGRCLGDGTVSSVMSSAMMSADAWEMAQP